MIVENKGTLKPDLHWAQNVEARDILRGAMQLNLRTKYKKRILIDIFYVNNLIFVYIFLQSDWCKKNIKAKGRISAYVEPRKMSCASTFFA